MSMLSEVQKEFALLQKQIAHENKKLEALRAVMQQYAVDNYPDHKNLNMIVMECLRRNEGKASFMDIRNCIADHQITVPPHRLSMLLTKHPTLQYDRAEKLWRKKEMAA